MGFRRSFSGWIGGVTVLFGLAFLYLGVKALELPMTAVNQAVGVPLFGSIFVSLNVLFLIILKQGQSLLT